MRRQKKDLAAGCFFLCLTLLTGCARAERTKTIVLPEPAKVQEAAETQGDGYQVKKIYTREYEAAAGCVTSILDCDEHEMRIAEVDGAEYDVHVRRVDYRYGFYEEEGKEGGDRFAIYDWMAEDDQRFLRNALSPSGRYLLWKDQVTTHIGPKIYLRNIKTGEDTLLLDADVAGKPGDQYDVLNAWSGDGKYLSYCFFPKTRSAYEKNAKEETLISILEIETKTIVGQYAYTSSTDGRSLLLAEASMYLDVADGKAMNVIAILRDPSWVDGTWLDVCTLGIEADSNEENMLTLMSEGVETLDYFQPSARMGKLYMGGGFDRIYDVDAETGMFGEEAVMESYTVNGEVSSVNRTNKYLILDEEQTIFTTEVAELGEDVCIYQKKNGIWERRVLYHYNAGALTYLQYDGEHHRLLAVSSASYRYGAPQTAIVLEFE